MKEWQTPIYDDAVGLAKKLRELSEQMRKQDFTVTDGIEIKDWTDVVKMKEAVSDIRNFFGNEVQIEKIL